MLELLKKLTLTCRIILEYVIKFNRILTVSDVLVTRSSVYSISVLNPCNTACIYIRECGSTRYVAPTNTKFKPLLLPIPVVMSYTNIYKHRTSYFKSTLPFLGPAKHWKSISAARQKPEILAIFS